MSDYQPLDLAPVCNVGVEVLGDSAGEPQLGRVSMRGLPFLIGAESPSPQRCFVAPTAPVSIEVGQPVRKVVVAHRLLRPAGPAGHGVGTPAADYVFHFADGEVSTVPIRERFEIQVVPTDGFRFPYVAVSDTHDRKMSRFTGPWSEAGIRLVEHLRGRVRSFYLWCWDNPHPDAVLERIELIPRDLPFLVAGITLGHGEEHPFVRTPFRPVRLVVTDPDLAGRDDVLDVEVDRGVSTYPQPLPTDEDDRPGYGASNAPPPASPAYAHIAALPSATVTVRQRDTELGKVTWADLEHHGHAAADKVRLELIDPGRNWVHVKVLDDATGQQVPCRVHFRSPEGIPYQPHGHHHHVNQNLGSWHYDVGGDVRLGQQTYAYIDGTCQGWLPRGNVVVDVARGFEYAPLRETVRIEPGQRELTLRLHRTTDMAARGWWSGDSHVHFLSTSGSQLEQLGEDVRVVNVLQTQLGGLFTGTEEFTGRPAGVHSAVDGGDFLTYVGQENRQYTLGHMVMWGLEQPVMPFCSDGPDEAELGGAMDATLSDWADRTHAQGGTVVAAHFPNPNGEPAVLVATGRADAVELLTESKDSIHEYYRYLNSGYRLPLVGGTDKMSSAVPVGLYRTYAKLGSDEEFTYDGWCRAVRSGRTFLSGGPLLNLTVDGREPGDTIELTGPGTLTIQASVTSIFPLRSLEIVCNGEVVAVAQPDGADPRSIATSEKIRIEGSTWIAARAFGTQHHLDEWNRQVFAHTSPVYLGCGGPWTMADPDGLHYMRTLVTGARDYVRHRAVRRADHLTTHHHGEPDHLSWLERPFTEALEALDRRS